MSSRPPAPPRAPAYPIDILHERLRWIREQPMQRAGDLVEFHAFCPVHDAGVEFEPGASPEPPDRPLRIYADRNGTIERFECDDGCTQTAVLRALSLDMMDLIANPWADEPGAFERMRTDKPPGGKKSMAGAGDAKPSEPSIHAYEPIVVRLSDVRPETLEWLWPGRIPLGKLTVIAGDPGLGKTFLTHDIAARVSTGSPWPDDAGVAHDAGEVILLSAEDGLADTIRPRLDAAGADASRIIALTAVRSFDGHETAFNLARDLRSLELVLQGCQRPRLVVIDPISAYLSRTDSHNNAEVRALLAPLAKLAEGHRVAVVAINHLNKSGGGKAIYRSMGSLAFIAAARAGWLIARSADDPERRLMLVAKMNVAKEPTGLSYRIVDGRIAWDAEPVSVTADEALNNTGEAAARGGGGGGGGGEDEGGGRESVKLREAIAWLHARLEGGEMEASQLDAAAAEAGISRSTLRRAKSLTKLSTRRDGFGGHLFLSRQVTGLPAHAPH